MAAMMGGVADRMRAGPRSWRGWLMGWRLWLWWVLASTVGWAVGGTVGEAVGGGLSRDINVAGYVSVAVGGIAAGVLQWLVLRRQVARAGWWVLASAVGWVVGGLMAGIAAGIVGWVVAGAVYGAITGPVLVWLLRQPVPAAATEE